MSSPKSGATRGLDKFDNMEEGFSFPWHAATPTSIHSYKLVCNRVELKFTYQSINYIYSLVDSL